MTAFHDNDLSYVDQQQSTVKTQGVMDGHSRDSLKGTTARAHWRNKVILVGLIVPRLPDPTREAGLIRWSSTWRIIYYYDAINIYVVIYRPNDSFVVFKVNKNLIL